MPLFAEIDWQPLIAYAVVAVAAAWVARRAWQVVRRATRSGSGQPSGGCGSCLQNPRSTESAKVKPLVQLDAAPRRDKST